MLPRVVDSSKCPVCSSKLQSEEQGGTTIQLCINCGLTKEIRGGITTYGKIEEPNLFSDYDGD